MKNVVLSKRTTVTTGQKPRQRKSALSADKIYLRILQAITEHQLPPGTRLVEERLARIFGVSRTKVRQALGRLVHDRIVTVFPRRGAFVSSPSEQEAREIFDARRLIEPELIRRVTRQATPVQIARLRVQIGREAEARRVVDRRAIIAQSGEFHQLIADMAGNAFLARTMRELESLTCLIITLYDAPKALACPYHEHGELLDVIEAGDADGAADQMRRHLDHVEAALDLSLSASVEPVLEDIFA